MDTQKMDSYKEFAKHIEYPMVIFDADSGEVLHINYEAGVLIGTQVKKIHIEPGKALNQNEFWETLHGRKSLIWHRIRMMADDREYLVSGLIHEAAIEDRIIYTLLFERRADLNIGSVTLERIINHAGIVALHMTRGESGFQLEYVSQNINQYGYTRAQFYERLLDITEMVCPEDLESINASMKRAIDLHMEEDTLECRLFTEERELIPVRLLVHYIYDDNNRLTDFEILIIDLREELRRSNENNYLRTAIDKMKSVVLVKSYNAGKRTLKYASPNAGMVGMNIEALRKGYKLTEDYIHPDDRDVVIDGIYQAVANGITDYVQTYRMIRDDGKQIWVENVFTVNRVSDGEAEISFLLTDITEQKDLEKELAATLEALEGPKEEKEQQSSLELVTINENDTEMLAQFQLMAETLSRNADYYSVVLDTAGKLLTQPAGPAGDLGQFYDLFERPSFKEQFQELSERAREQKIPQSATVQDGSLEVHLVLAPLTLETNVTAYWTLTSFAKNGRELLGSVAEQQWRLANCIAQCFYAEELVQRERHRRKLAEMRIHKKQQERHVMEDLGASMLKEGDAALGEMCQKAGIYLGVTNIGVYLKNKDTDTVENYYAWNQNGDMVEFFHKMIFTESEYEVICGRFEQQPVQVIDRQNDPLFKSPGRISQAEAIMLIKLPFVQDLEGYMVFGHTERGQEFDKRDVRLANYLCTLVAAVIQKGRNQLNVNMLNEGFLSAYDHIRDAVFVKNNRTGDIVFANKSMDKLFGYSLVGMQAGDVIKDQMEQYRNMQSVRKRLIADKKVTKWQSYLKELDQIMNIVEVHLDTINGTDYSLVILKKNKNKDKKKG